MSINTATNHFLRRIRIYVLSCTGSRANTIGKANPIRYRGYVYDEETGLYYLGSRYYDPEVGRFINADDRIVCSEESVLGANAFSYCSNNPVIREDENGTFWNVVIGAIVGAVVGVAGQLVSDIVSSLIIGQWKFSNWQTYVGAVVGGAVGGAILGGTGNVALSNAATGFVTTGVGLSLEKITGESDKSWAEIGLNAVADGAISYGLGKLPGINGVTQGRNGMAAVYKEGLTKIRNRTASYMSGKDICKGVISGLVSGLALDGYYGIKQVVYEPVKKRMLSITECNLITAN